MSEADEQATAECGAERPRTVLGPLPGVVCGLSQIVPIKELDGPGGPEPTRFGDWERNGRCIDF